MLYKCSKKDTVSISPFPHTKLKNSAKIKKSAKLRKIARNSAMTLKNSEIKFLWKKSKFFLFLMIFHVF